MVAMLVTKAHFVQCAIKRTKQLSNRKTQSCNVLNTTRVLLRTLVLLIVSSLGRGSNLFRQQSPK